MPKYQVTTPDGRTYSVNAPDGASEQDAIAYVQKQFYQQERAPDPAEGMSGGQKFLAGVGKGMTDIGRGAGQMLGLVDREDVAESRRLDAPLMRTGAGTAGNLAGTLAMLAPTAMIPGANTYAGSALIGAGAGLLQPSVSTGETLANTGMGAVAAPAALLAGRGLASAYQGAKALAQPLYKGGQEKIAADVLRRSATDPAKAAETLRNAPRELVPGSQSTTGQMAVDPGLAQLERTLLNNPEMAGPLQARYAAQRAARSKAVADVAGSDDFYEAIKKGRSVFANEDYAKAIAEGIDDGMARAIQPQLDSLLERPSIQQAQGVARRLAKEAGDSINDFGSLKGMDYLKKALDNRISIGSQPGSSIGKEELRLLVQTKNDLMATIEQIAPSYKMANDNYAKMSRQVNSMDVARQLQATLMKPGSEYATGSGREFGEAYQRALSNAIDSVKKSTGQNKTLAEVMNTGDIFALENVARDLGRKAYGESAGRAVGSPTAQNMISQNLLRRAMGPVGLPESFSEATMLQGLLSPVQMAGKVAGADRKITERLAASLLDPTDAAGLLAMPSGGLLGLERGIASGGRYLPALGLLGVTTRERQ